MEQVVIVICDWRDIFNMKINPTAGIIIRQGSYVLEPVHGSRVMVHEAFHKSGITMIIIISMFHSSSMYNISGLDYCGTLL